MTRVAVLGASGCLGKKIVSAFSINPEVSVVGFSRGSHRSTEPIESFFQEVSGFDVIVNAFVDYGKKSHQEAYEANLVFPLRVVDALIR